MICLPHDIPNQSLREVNDRIFTIRQPQSDGKHSLYALNGLFSLSYHYCSGITSQDTYTMLNISANACNYAHHSAEQYIKYQNHRAMHNHDYYEVMLVLDGEITHVIEEKEITYTAGYGCLVNRSVMHSEKFSGSATLLFIGISPLLATTLIDHYNSRSYRESSTPPNRFLEFIRDDLAHPSRKKYMAFFPTLQCDITHKAVNEIAENIVDSALHPHLGTFYLLCGYICRLTEVLIDPQQYHIAEMELDSRPDFLLFQRINFMLNETHGRITRHELETALNYSGSYINKVVKRYSGLNLFNYGMTFCFNYVENQLLTTSRSIDSIMLELNFKNPTHFFKLFKERYGMPPGEYRKKQIIGREEQ